MRTKPEMTQIDIKLEDVTIAIRKTSNWKAPGLDSIYNYWLKKITAAHEKIAYHFNEILHRRQQMPLFLTKGKTFLLPKEAYTRDPSKYRPITCLCTMHKVLTSIISNKIYEHLHLNNIMTEEQRGCYKNSQGCKDQVTIDTVIVQEALKKKRNLSMTYIDYKKAFDSIPHSFLIEILQIYKIDNNLIEMIKAAMETSSTTLILTDGKKMLNTRSIRIRRGIYQRDSLSALWFCIGINPLSQTLNDTAYDFKIKSQSQEHVIKHLLYMDEIKLYGSCKEQMEKFVNITEKYSSDIQMEFGLNKCKTINLTDGTLGNTEGILTNDN